MFWGASKNIVSREAADEAANAGREHKGEALKEASLNEEETAKHED